MKSKAYQDGYVDGLAWDLDGFDDAADVAAAPAYSWATATINAIGSDACARAWGARCRHGSAWDRALSDYNRGCLAGVTAPQEQRSGLPPRVSGE